MEILSSLKLPLQNPEQPLVTDSDYRVVTGAVEIADVSGLQDALDSKATASPDLAMRLSQYLESRVDTLGGWAANFVSLAGVSSSSENLQYTSSGFKPNADADAVPTGLTTATQTSGTTWIHRDYQVLNYATITAIWAHGSTAVNGVNLKIALENTATNYDIVATTGDVNLTSGGWQRFALTSPFKVPFTGTYRIAFYHPSGASRTVLPSGPRVTKSGNATGSGQTFSTQSAGSVPAAYAEYDTSDLSLVLLTRTSAANPSFLNVYALITETNSLSGSDLTFHASRDGGTTFSSGTPSRVGQVGTQNLWRAKIDVSGQPSGSGYALKIAGTHSKNYEIKATAVLS